MAEYQARGAVHFHVLIRLDGVDVLDPKAIAASPAGLTAADLTAAIRHAAGAIQFVTEPHPSHPGGWLIAWGPQTDIRTIAMSGNGTVTDSMVAGYLAKYATKGTEITGHASRRLTPATVGLHADPDGDHVARLIHAAWTLGACPGVMFGKDHGWDSLQRWAHMLGFGGHFLTKARRYSVTFTALRRARSLFRQAQVLADFAPDDRRQDCLTLKRCSSSTACPMTATAGGPPETHSSPAPPPIRPGADDRPHARKQRVDQRPRLDI